jgi:hypothetical protein
MGIVWYTDGSKSDEGTGAGVYGCGTRMRLSFSLGQYMTLFQAELYAIKACTMEIIHKGHNIRIICILP